VCGGVQREKPHRTKIWPPSISVGLSVYGVRRYSRLRSIVEYCRLHPQSLLSSMTDTKYMPAPTEPPPSYETAAQPTPPKPAPPSRAPLPLDLPVINSLRGKRCILASASPRRKQLLSQVIGQGEIQPFIK